MKVWIIQIGEPIVGIDDGARAGRCNMLCDALTRRGHEVTWWNSTFHHFRKAYRFPGLHVAVVRPGLTVRLLHGTPPYRRNASFQRLLNQRSIARQFKKAAGQGDPPDVIFACLPTPELCEAAVRHGRLKGVPVIVDVRDPWPDLYLKMFPKPLRGLARLVLTPEYRRAARIFQGATAVTAVSETYLRWALAHARRAPTPRDRVFHIGYQPTPAEGESAAGTLEEFVRRHRLDFAASLLTFCGVFGVSYDLETVVECARLFQAEGRNDIQFVLAGDGDKAGALRRQAAALRNIVFTGWLDQPSLRMLMKVTAVGLCAYTPEALQSLPNKPFEYMAAGLPQISSLGGELEEILRQHRIGLHYAAGDARSLHEQVARLVGDPETRRQMSLRARQVFQEYFDAALIYPALAAHLEQIAQLRLVQEAGGEES